MNKFLLLALLLLTSANASAAILQIGNYIWPETFLIVRYQICTERNQCSGALEVRITPEEPVSETNINVPRGQIATVTALTATYYDYDRREERTVKLSDCSTEIKDGGHGSLTIKKERGNLPGRLMCVGTYQMGTK